MLRITVLLAAMWTASSMPAVAQGTGGLKGLITDQSGALVPGAQIRVTSDSGVAREATSTGDGSYTMNGLAPGAYSVRASSPGLLQADAASIDINGNVATLNISLRLVLEKQEVTVQDQLGGQVDTDPSQSAASLVVSGDNLDALSDDPDDLMADLQALAGPSAGPSGAQFYIDGFTAGDAVLPSKSSIREIRVNQNPFSPEFDAIGYGRTEIFTKPGMDKYRGQAFFNYGNDSFNSRNPYALQKAPYSLIDPGGSFGGPLNKKASFFVDIDRRHIDNGVVINATVLDPSFAIVPFSQVASAPALRLRISPRLDYQLNANNTLMFRYGLTDSDNDANGIGNFNLATRAYRQTNIEHAFQATETAVLSAKVIDETHFQFLHQHQTQDSPDLEPTRNVSSAFVGGGPGNSNYFYIHHHYEAQNYVSIAAGKHTIKTGVRLRAVSIQDSSRQNFNGTYSFGGAYAPILDANFQSVVPNIVCSAATPDPGCRTITSIEQYQRAVVLTQAGRNLSAQEIRRLGGGATQFSQNKGNPLVLVGQVDAGIFAGDDWRVRPNLTFSYGLRYEMQTNIHDRKNFAPRIAMAWAPGTARKGAPQKTVIRFGTGIFYDRFNEQNILIAERFDGSRQKQFVITNPDTFPDVPSDALLQQFTSALAVHTVSPILTTPYVIQTASGLERQLPWKTTLAVTWTNSHALHQLRSRNINAPVSGYTGVRGSGVYPFGNIGPILEMESAGLYNQNQFVANLNSRVNSKISLFGFYTWSYARSNTDGVNSFPANQYDLSGEYGPSSNDVRHRGTLGGSIATYWNLRFSPLIGAQSGMPFNITTSQDIYGDTLATARPGIATNAGQTGKLVPYGNVYLDPNPVPGEAVLTRNFGRSPGQFYVDLRIARTFALRRGHGERRARPAGDPGSVPVIAAPVAGPARRNGIGGFDGVSTAVADAGGGRNYNLTVSVSGRNILNHVNPGPVVGNINSPLFGRSNEVAGGNGASSNRRLEFQLRLAF